MPESYKKRRRRERPIRQLAAGARRDLHLAAEDLGVDLDERDERTLVAEAVLLADPYAYGSIDAASPAHRWDLRREFFRRRLRGEGEGRLGLERLARELAPSPDAPAPSVRRPHWGTDAPTTYNEVLPAFRSRAGWRSNKPPRR